MIQYTNLSFRPQKQVSTVVCCDFLYCRLFVGSDVFSTSTDGRVMWWDIRKLGEPVETLLLEFAGYRSGQKLGGISLEYESTMVRYILSSLLILLSFLLFFSSANQIHGWNGARCYTFVQSQRENPC